MMCVSEAPRILRIPISLNRCCVSRAAKPNSPKKEIKIANIYSSQIKEGKTKEESLIYTVDVTGETKNYIESSFNKYNMIQNSFARRGINFKYKWFEKTSEQFKGMISFVNRTFKSRKEPKNKWFVNNTNEMERFIDNSILFILYKPRAVGGTRDLFKTYTTNIVESRELFNIYMNFIDENLDIDEIINILDRNDAKKLSISSAKANKFMDDLIMKLKEENSFSSLKAVVSSRVKEINSINYSSVKKYSLEEKDDMALKYIKTSIIFARKMLTEDKTEESIAKIKELIILLTSHIEK